MIDYEGKYFHFDNCYWETPKAYNAISVYQIGDLSCKGGFEIGEHLQPCYEISYILSGKGVFILDGAAFEVKKGDIFFCQPEQAHNLIADRDDPFRYLYLAFFFDKAIDYGNPFSYVEKLFERIKSPLQKDTLRIDIPFSKVMQELHIPAEFSSSMVESYLTQIILLTCRTFCQEQMDLPNGKGQYTNGVVYAITAYIDNHLQDMEHLTDLAKHLNYSYSYISRLFAAETGISLQAYHNKKRIERAMELLADFQLSVNDISLLMQYQSIHSFSKAFKNAVGLSPIAYRRFLKEKDSQL